ncbi:hypothetical protein [Ekhidna sp.]|uniref:hypothetical protein n=1 Tax=Ekhidna sp. TaxID=2608089 RepID=UPI003CCBC2DB
MKYLIRIVIPILFLNPTESFGQVEFEKGYFLDAEGKRVECLIKNLGWFENPTSFDYKLNESSEILTRTISNTKVFAIGTEVKYKKYIVEVDLSSDNVDELTADKNPSFTEKEVFLRQLIEGELNLFNYIEGNVQRFFISNEEIEPTQLIYKRYRVDAFNVGVNNKYKGQLKYLFTCGDKISTQNISYAKSSLLNYVKKVYECKGLKYQQYRESNSGLFNAKVKLGYRITSHTIETERGSGGFGSNIISEDLDASNGPVFGLEFEYTLPFMKNKLSIPLNVIYQSASYEKSDTELYPNDHTFRMEYSSIEIYPSIRYNYFLNKSSSLGFSAGFVMDLILNDLNQLEITDGTKPVVLDDPFFETNSASNFILAANFKSGNYYAEISYGLNRNLSNFSSNWNSKYSYLNFIVGYTIFTSK